MPYRLLLLDGGGSWAILQSKALGAIYGPDTDGWAILDRFDFAAANSGGALVLALLLGGLTPDQIAASFRDRRKREYIFERNTVVVDRALGGLLGFGARYDAPGKLLGLTRILDEAGGRFAAGFSAMTLDRIAAAINADRQARGIAPFHFIITAFDFDAERTAFFRSDPESMAKGYRRAPMPTIAGALHASTNAPLRYYNRPAEIVFADGRTRNYWDGAAGGYNNPILAAVVEALAIDQRRRDRIVALSLGNGGNRLPVVMPEWPGNAAYVVRPKRSRGPDSVRLVSDMRKLSAAIMVDRPEAASFIAHVMLGEPVSAALGAPVTQTRVVRMNPMIQPRHAGLDANGHPNWQPYEWFDEPSTVRGRTLFERLVTLDMDITEDGGVLDVERLADLWIAGKVPNQPILADDRLVPEIGQGWFADALAQWRLHDAEVRTPLTHARPERPPMARLLRWLRGLRSRSAPRVSDTAT